MNLFICAILSSCASGFYVPGVAPRDYSHSELVEIKAVKMTSSKTQLPFEYYSLNFCKPPKVEYQSENLGEVLRGDRIVNTLYNVNMNVPSNCLVQCEQTMSAANLDLFKERIEQDYVIHLLADNLPSATKFVIDNEISHLHGFKLGFKLNDKYYINNHLDINIKYNKLASTSQMEVFRIVGFEVEPKSVSNMLTSDDHKTCKISQGHEFQEIKPSTNQVTFSYSVNWEKSETRWASRWDMYLEVKGDVNIHWFSILNSVIIIIFLFAIISIIIFKTIRRDINQYNREEDEEALMDEAYEKTGWKLVHGDIFRPPQHRAFFVANLGAGIQLIAMSGVTVLIAMMGMLSPSARGSLLQTMIFLFMFMGFFAGYYSTRFYKSLKGKNWFGTSIMTGVYYPAISFGACFMVNFFVWHQGSSKAVPFTTMLALLCMWLGISMPLTLIGSFFGFKKQPFGEPVRTNQIPRAIPEQPFSSNIFIKMVLAGALPFGAVFIELFFILESLFENEFYYMFGFLFLVFVIVIIAVAQISIVLVYYQLCNEDHCWMWKSFISGGGISLYVFGYLIYYHIVKLDITSFTPIVLYFSYSILFCFTIWIVCGTVGFIASYCFIRQIYSQIKID